MNNLGKVNRNDKDIEKNLFSLSFYKWLFLTLASSSIFYIIVGLTFPYSEPGLTVSEVIIVRIMILICIPILTLPILLESLPAQQLTINKRSIQRFLLHKVFFILTSPILYLSYLGELFLLKLYPAFKESKLQEFLLVSLFWLVIIPWILITLYFWELVFGKDSSNTLKRLRLGKKRNKSSSLSKNTPSGNTEDVHEIYSRRWLMIVLGILFLLLMLAIIVYFLNFNFLSKDFLLAIIMFSGLDIGLFLLIVPFYKKFLIKNGFELKILNKINSYVFGLEDISLLSFQIGFLLFFSGPIILIFFYDFFQDPFFNNLTYLLIFIIYIGIFFLIVWNNQIKRVLGFTTVNKD